MSRAHPEPNPSNTCASSTDGKRLASNALLALARLLARQAARQHLDTQAYASDKDALNDEAALSTPLNGVKA